MKVEVTCLGCGVEAAVPVENTLPLCAACSKAAKAKARGVSRSKKPPKAAEASPASKPSKD